MVVSDYRKMIDRARKAGLNTRDIYSVLAVCQPATSQRFQQDTDSNGFVNHIDANGKSDFIATQPLPR